MNFVIQSTFKNPLSLNWAVGISSISFALLFHQADIGINLAIFDLIILLFWVITMPHRFKETGVLLSTVALLATSVCTAWYGSPDTIIWSIVCLTWISQQMVYPDNSFLFFETKAFINIFLSPINAIADLTLKSEGGEKTKQVRSIFFVIILPLLIAFLFAFLYSLFNPYFHQGFDDFMQLFDFSILPLLVFGIIACVYLFKTHLPAKLNFVDQVLSNNFPTESSEDGNPSLSLKKQAGLSLFGILNVVLIVFLISDIVFVTRINQGLEESYSAFVHRGVGILIFSIIIATSFILFFFRGRDIGMLANNDWLKRFALLWVILNIILLLTTGTKNLFYVIEYGLTLKRIGVFVYLILSMAGLFYAFLKVYLKQTNAYLFRKLYWSFFIILTVNLCIDWSSITTRFNIHENIKDQRHLDWSYLLQLDRRILPIILEKRNLLNIEEHHGQSLDQRLEQSRSVLLDYDPSWRSRHLALSQAQSKVSSK